MFAVKCSVFSVPALARRRLAKNDRSRTLNTERKSYGISCGAAKLKHLGMSDLMEERVLKGRIVIRSGDITQEAVDAIVNAANSTLLGGGGVDGAIHRRGGPAILEECRRIREMQYRDGLPTGEAVMTTAGDLPARFVIHTVGPIYGMNDGRDAELLAACYRNSVDLALAHNLNTISFPSISTGAFGYPKHERARSYMTPVRYHRSAFDYQCCPCLLFRIRCLRVSQVLRLRQRARLLPAFNSCFIVS